MLNALEEVAHYLRLKVRLVNVANPKSNVGGVLLKLHKPFEVEIEDFVFTAFHIIQAQFSKETVTNEKAQAGLTNVSMRIGKVIGKKLQRDPLPYHREVRLGDIFIEAFDECEFIDLEYKKIRTEGYNVHCGERWTELAAIPVAKVKDYVYASSEVCPIDITSFTQDTGSRKQTIIKKPEDWFRDLDYSAPWIKSMNVLQQTGWKINDVVLEAVVNNPPSDVPCHDTDAEIKRKSKIVEHKFIVNKATLLAGKTFYQYGETDYRGRFYYSESFLNFQGSDKARGMFLFAEGKAMTERGLDWLAIHTANSFNQSYKIDDLPNWAEKYRAHLEKEELEDISLDKMTLLDRYEWTLQNMELIMKGEYNPDAEKPVAFLAACLEWRRYYLEGEGYISYLPIPIDGSNNGWQHLGAISKDEETGRLVGLVPVEIQKDFYVQTAKEMIALNKKDHLAAILDAMPMKHIRKGISKRGSMTRAYSAGANKIADNMFLDCRTEGYTDKYKISKADCKGFARTLIKAIDNVCPGPLDTMSYLQKLAAQQIGKYKKVQIDGEGTQKDFDKMKDRRKELNENQAKSEEELQELNSLSQEMFTYEHVLEHGLGKSHLEWTTPTGFPVKYENYKMQKHRTKGRISGRYITHVIALPSTIPDFQGYMSGISPNFIHSQDASHLALTVAEWGGSFGAVHDSFSAHACDIDELLHVTKSTFIDMYDHENYFDVIRSNLTDGTDDEEQPALGTLNIQEIHNSDYFFA